jgi:chromosome segregation ATPase
VWNPAWLAYPRDTEFSKDDIHAIDNEALRHCDAIYMLKGWRYSEGARNEHKIAVARELDIMYEETCSYSFKFNLSKAPEKDTSVFDREFAYDEAIKNRTNYQLEAIKENVKEKYNTLDKRIKSIEEELAWDKWKNDLPDNFCSNRIDSLEKWRNDFTECYTVNITNLRKEVEAIKESIGTDNLKEQLDKDFDDVYEEFENTKDKVNDIEFGYINWSYKMSSAIDEMEKVKETVKGLNSLVATLGERNGVLSDKIESGIEENIHYRLSITEQLGTIRSRLKAIDNLENTNEVHWINIQGLDKKLDELIHNVAELEKDQVDINSKVAKKLDDYKEALEKKSNDWQELQCIINNSDIENISIKAMNQKLIDLGSELDDYIDDYKEAYKHLNNADEALERRIKALEDNRGSLHEECWTEIHRLSKEIDKLNTAIDILGKDTGSIAQKRCDDNKVINNTLSTIDICLDDINNRLKAIEGIHDGININNTLNNFNIRLKAIEKRLSIKPFYEPTEDEKDD